MLNIGLLKHAMTGVPAAYYPIHSMGTAHGFGETDRQAAENFAAAARAEGIQRIIYLGGLGSRVAQLSPHLRSRQEVGEILRKWRVEVFEPGRRLRLAAEMKLPGRAWLEFDVAADTNGSVIRQTAIFDPIGLPGLLYWYFIYPPHHIVFAGMLRGIAHAAESTWKKR